MLSQLGMMSLKVKYVVLKEVGKHKIEIWLLLRHLA